MIDAPKSASTRCAGLLLVAAVTLAVFVIPPAAASPRRGQDATRPQPPAVAAPAELDSEVGRVMACGELVDCHCVCVNVTITQQGFDITSLPMGELQACIPPYESCRQAYNGKACSWTTPMGIVIHGEVHCAN